MNFHEAWWKKNPSPLPTSTTTSNHSPFLSTGLVSRGLWLYLTLSLKCLAYGKPWSKLFCSKTHRAQCQKKSSVHFMYKWTEVPDERRPSSLSPRELVAVMRKSPCGLTPRPLCLPLCYTGAPVAVTSGTTLTLTHLDPSACLWPAKWTNTCKIFLALPGSPSYF